MDGYFEVLVKKRLHEFIILFRNGHSDQFILIKSFLTVLLLQNTVINPQTHFLHFLSGLLGFDTSKTAKKVMNESGNFVV